MFITPSKQKAFENQKRMASQYKSQFKMSTRTKLSRKKQREKMKQMFAQLINDIQQRATREKINQLQQRTWIGYFFYRKSIQKLIKITQRQYKVFSDCMQIYPQQDSTDLQKLLTILINYFNLDINYYFNPQLVLFCLKILKQNKRLSINQYALSILGTICCFQQVQKLLQKQNSWQIILKANLSLEQTTFKYSLNYLNYCKQVTDKQFQVIVEIVLKWKNNYSYFIYSDKEKGYLQAWTVHLIQLLKLLLQKAHQSPKKMQILSRCLDLASQIIFKIEISLKQEDELHLLKVVKFIFILTYPHIDQDQEQPKIIKQNNRQLFKKIWGIFQSDIKKSPEQIINKERQKQSEVQSNQKLTLLVELLRIFCKCQDKIHTYNYLKYIHKQMSKFINYKTQLQQILLRYYFTCQNIFEVTQIALQNILEKAFLRSAVMKLLQWKQKTQDMNILLELKDCAIEINVEYNEKCKGQHIDPEILEMLKTISQMKEGSQIFQNQI